MVRKGERTRNFVTDNYNILVTMQHKRKSTKVIISNKYAIKDLVRAGIVIFADKRSASIAYRYKQPVVPTLKKNILRLADAQPTR